MEAEGSVNTATLSDEEIVRRVIAGEIHLYEQLMRKYNLRLFRISRSVTGSEEDAEDIMQNTYVNAYMQLGSFMNKSAFSTWLIRILVNESLLWKKRNLKRQQLMSEKPDVNGQTNDTPLNNLMNTELKYILEKAVSDLPEKYRVVFVMREIEDMSTNETMDALNLSESNVKVRLTRAKEALRQNLGAYYKCEQVFAFHLSRCNKVVGNVMSRILTN